MEAREIYRVLKSIIEPIHAHNDQMVAIAKWIEAEFEYKPQKQASGVNNEQKALHTVGVRRSALEWWNGLGKSQQQDEILNVFGGNPFEDNTITDADIEHMYIS